MTFDRGSLRERVVPIGHEPGCVLANRMRPCHLEQLVPGIAIRAPQNLRGKASRDVLANRMPLVTVYPTLTLFEIHGV